MDCFQDADRDGSGSVDFQEFVELMIKRESEKETVEDLKQVFRVFDKVKSWSQSYHFKAKADLLGWKRICINIGDQICFEKVIRLVSLSCFLICFNIPLSYIQRRVELHRWRYLRNGTGGRHWWWPAHQLRRVSGYILRVVRVMPRKCTYKFTKLNKSANRERCSYLSK